MRKGDTVREIIRTQEPISKDLKVDNRLIPLVANRRVQGFLIKNAWLNSERKEKITKKLYYISVIEFVKAI